MLRDAVSHYQDIRRPRLRQGFFGPEYLGLRMSMPEIQDAIAVLQRPEVIEMWMNLVRRAENPLVALTGTIGVQRRAHSGIRVGSSLGVRVTRGFAWLHSRATGVCKPGQ